jgi:hypothetical protein
MEFKRLISKYVYHIEPRPGGGFIARATDPSVPGLEAATREELREKIQATVFAGLNHDFPGLKLPLEAPGKQFAFHVERNAEGGFHIHSSSDPGASPVAAATHDEVESHFAEKLVGLFGNYFAPELAQALAAPGAKGDIKVFVKTTGFTVKSGGPAIDPFGLSTPPDGGAALASAAQLPSVPANMDTPASQPTFSDRSLAGSYSGDGGPIYREPFPTGNNRWSAVVRFLLALLMVAAAVYFFFLRHH